MIRTLAGKRIGIVGMGRSGIGAARLVHRLGGTVLISDIRNPDALREEMDQLSMINVEIETGKHEKIISERFDIVILSPGVVPNFDMLLHWSQTRTPVWSEIELAAQVCDHPWIGVTGSNGKTTTVHLIEEIIKQAGMQAKAVGNIGNAWSEHLPARENDAFVVEISSFQLERIEQMRPHVGVILNITENHLDRHHTLETYALLKFDLLKNQEAGDVAVLNADDPVVMSHRNNVKSQIVTFGSKWDSDWVVNAYGFRHVVGGKVKFEFHARDFHLPGRHNLMNAAAAAAASLSYGADYNAIGNALKNASAVEHRIEFIRETDGVRWINDSKSTNLTATITAINATDPPTILLFGGRAKKESFAPLQKFLPNPVKKIIAFGEARSKILSDVGPSKDIYEVETLFEAVSLASKLSQKGDTVLLSPGCASFDQFKNFEERGRVFKQLVNSL